MVLLVVTWASDPSQKAGLAILYFRITSVICHVFTLYLPAPLGRYYRRRKNREPIQREVEESYQASRRQWQTYLVQHVRFIALLTDFLIEAKRLSMYGPFYITSGKLA